MTSPTEREFESPSSFPAAQITVQDASIKKLRISITVSSTHHSPSNTFLTRYRSRILRA
nr:MAG TPA: hypothetical protein [Caudoviricetes sp.]